ncbi:hypothetical protein [Mycobacterium sp. AZCC_0083]|uniref:hypothetical protein n=1 Tax=Mycobacterium sp. AZCC_0083 TaxID=2735882 RepID=UPI00161E556F|nr:hypothetical protein [Mycobacterium sp. AZCC_0083]MBB5161592.1 hypothetical protein [Mycobacterium sp. AZCC_0083]
MPAIVHSVLVAHDIGDGMQLTHKRLAKLTNMPVIKVRRAIDTLRDAGLLKAEAVFQDNWQQANLYQIPTSAKPDRSEQPPAHSEQPNSYIYQVDKDKKNQEVVDNQVVLPKKSYPDTDLGGESRASLREEATDLQAVEPGKVDRDRDTVITLADLDQPGGARSARSQQAVPVGARSARMRRDNIFSRFTKANEIVETFHASIEEATQREVKNQQRIRGWHTSARVLLQDGHSLEEVLEVIGYVFGQGLMDKRHGPEKITNLKQIRDEYEYFLESTKLGKPAPPQLPETPSWNIDLINLRRRLEEHR